MITCIKNVRIVDGRGDCIEKGSVIFDENSIIKISINNDVTNADKVIDGKGYTLMPGLIESHAHLAMDSSASPFAAIENDSQASTAIKACLNGQEFLKHGVTTIRNMGTKYGVDIEYRNMVDQGLIIGPRVVASGELITITGGHGHVLGIECDTPQEVKKATRQQIKKGVDVVKLIATGGILTKGSEVGAPQLSEEDMRLACQEADLAGKTSAAHGIGVSGIKNAIRAGVTTLEHGYFIDDEAIDLMIQHNTYYVPTLIVPISLIRNESNSENPDVKEALKKAMLLPQNHEIAFKKALAAGIKIIAGTDQGTPYNFPGAIVEELRLFVEYGMSPMEAIIAATYTAAECMKLDNVIGSIEEGKLADLILIDGNPTENISDIENVYQVYKSGKLIVEN